ncbi:MAG: hypothetical protein AB7K71_37950 [Polyangiaceae bacterium]
MTIPLNGSHFRAIANEVKSTNWTLGEWAEHESDDWFQEGPFLGGFDATEMEFCFSYFSDIGELWFQMPLEQVLKVAAGEDVIVEARRADR